MIDTRSCEYCDNHGCNCIAEHLEEFKRKKYKDKLDQRKKADSKQRYATTRNKRS